MTSFRRHSILAALLIGSLASYDRVVAENILFGGKDEKFVGAGDKEPPHCTVNAPKTASEPFYISWYCRDQFNNTPPGDIRSAIWVFRNGDARFFKLDDFLGFPASLYVDHGLVKIGAEDDFLTGLPVTFRVEAMDKAGITTITEPFTVLAKRSSFESCDMTLVTAAGESNGDNTGTPSSTVSVSGAAITLESVTDSQIRFSTSTAVSADPCEISSVCDDDDKVTISATINAVDTSATGTVSVVPGSVSADVTGTVGRTSDLISSLSVSGTTTVDGSIATLTLTCGQTESVEEEAVEDEAEEVTAE